MLKPGCVLYFTDSRLTSNEPHYFVVLNENPKDDQIILALCSSSQIENVKRRTRAFPESTLVFVNPNEYSEFTKMSVFDCNTVFDFYKKDLIEKINSNSYKPKDDFPTELLLKLRNAMLQSPKINKSMKRIIDTYYN